MPERPLAELRQRALANLDALPPGEKPDKVRQVIEPYLQGTNIDAVSKAGGCSQSTVSLYLNAWKVALGVRVVRARFGTSLPSRRQTTPNRRRRISTRGSHSFRVTWISLGLAAGVPLDLVLRVSGHRTVAVV